MRIFDLHIIKTDTKNFITLLTNQQVGCEIRSEKESIKNKFMKDEIHHRSTIALEGARVSR